MARLIDKLTDQARQSYTLVGESGEQIRFDLIFMPTQSAWMFNVGYLDFQLNGVFLTVMPCVLYNYRNILPFDIMCASSDGYEPQFIDDFINGRISLYLLTKAEAQEVDTVILS